MAQKEFTVYNGIKYEKIIAEEIFNNKNQPTGHYTTISHSDISVLGLFDNEEILNTFYETLGFYLNDVWKHQLYFLLTSDRGFFIFGNTASPFTPGAQQFGNISSALLEVIQQIGYVESYEFFDDRLELIMIDKFLTEKELFTLTLKPYDKEVYSFLTWG